MKQRIEKVGFSPGACAQTYSLNVGTLANLRAQRRGPRFYRVGRKILYFREDIEAWLKQTPVLTRESVEVGR